MSDDVILTLIIVGIVAAYLLVANLVGFYSMWKDKRKAKRGEWRISEDELIMIALMGGSIGSLLGMKKFRHKTKHPKFYIGIPTILAIQVIIALIVFIYAVKRLWILY